MQKAKVQFVASRWAVKEAVVKAVGRKQLIFNQLQIVKDEFGKPYLQIHCEDNMSLIRKLNIDKIHISLAHQDDYTTAYALTTLK